MKPLIVSAVLICIFTISVNASNNNLSSMQMDSVKQSSLGQLLNLYYNIKNALANSDAATASIKADEFVKTNKDINLKTLSETERNSYSSLRVKLIAEAKDLSQSKDLATQRDHFASLSDDFYLLVKKVKLSTEPIYRDYCPMKKKYWLSSEALIKNPYYGKAMPTCGNITETLK